MDSNKPLIYLNGISFKYSGRTENVINDLSLKLYQGAKMGLIAPNGSGKTTLFHIIMGLIKPNKGEIEIFGKKIIKEKDFKRVRRQIGLLFQDADDQLFSPTVLEDVAFGPLNLGKSKSEAIEISLKTLKFLGLEGFEDRITFKLSGGEFILILTALSGFSFIVLSTSIFVASSDFDLSKGKILFLTFISGILKRKSTKNSLKNRTPI